MLDVGGMSLINLDGGEDVSPKSQGLWAVELLGFMIRQDNDAYTVWPEPTEGQL